jgi:hypothetical protein
MKINCAHTHHNHDPGGSRTPPGQHSGRPSSEVRFARGIRSLGRGPPRSRLLCPLGRGPPRSRPSSEVRLARGLSIPSGGVRFTRGHSHARCPRAPVPARAYEHLRLYTPGNHAPALFRQLPRGNPSPPLFSTVRQGRCQLRDTVPPTPGNTSRPRRGASGTLKYFFRADAGPRRDVGPTGSITPVAVSPVRPSQPLLLHAGHCGDIPALLRRAGIRHRHDDHCAAYGPPSTAPSNQPTTAAIQPTATPSPSKPRLYEHRTHHDASTEAGFARTAASSAALFAIPPHVGK